MAESDSAMRARNIDEWDKKSKDFWTASESLPIAPEGAAQMVKDSVDHGAPTRERICCLIGKYQCRRDDERISGREKKIYVDVLEDLQRLLETARQEGLQS
mgnify:FL=1